MSDLDEQAEQAVGAFTIDAPPRPSGADTPTAPDPDETWTLRGGAGTAHVFRGRGHTGGIVRPVIISDGFGRGASDLGALYTHLDGGAFPLVTTLCQRDRDVILLGYRERSASLLDNAQVAVDCIERARKERTGDARLVVGGFSMGGLITRYALASMETQRADHQTAVYFSFDTPHRGAVIPIGLQAFAHFVGVGRFAQLMNSPAARQMLWRHYDPKTGHIGIAPERTAFLAALDEVGGWPRRPHRLGMANGRSDGRGLAVPPGEVTLKVVGGLFEGTTFYAQSQGENAVVAELKSRIPPRKKTVTTDGFPELDGAPGGSLCAFGALAEALRKGDVERHHDKVCFIPTVSAVAIRDIDKQADLYATIDKLPPEQSELDEFRCSSDTTDHAVVTRDLGTWLLGRLPD